MTDQARPVDIGRAFIVAFGRRDMATVAGYVDDDIIFESPMTKTAGAAAYQQAVGSFAELVSGVEIIAAAGDDEQAKILYDMATVPFGTLKAAEYLVIRGGKITTDLLVFDTHELRKAQTSAQEHPPVSGAGNPAPEQRASHAA